jgi:hypothetical protein
MVQEPGCDQTKTDHECLWICAPDDKKEQPDDSGEMENEQDFDSSEAIDG